MSSNYVVSRPRYEMLACMQYMLYRHFFCGVLSWLASEVAKLKLILLRTVSTLYFKI